jgi:hypothetical protein
MAAQDYEQVSSRDPRLAQHRAYAQEIISGVGATRTLLAKESGALCLFDSAAGVVYTLPAPIVGMTFEFATSVTITSGAAKIITDAATTFLLGAVALVNDAATTAESFLADGTTIRAVSANGTTKGGVAGDCYRVRAISSTQWLVEGVLINSGTAATPFATS